jgi:hypothetical protein
MVKRAHLGLWTTCALLTLSGSVNAATGVASTPYGAVAAVLPGTIEAENFDNGGEGIAFHDLTAGNSGGAYRATDADTTSARSKSASG